MIATHGNLCRREAPRPQTARGTRPELCEGATVKEFDKSGRVVGRFRCVRLLGRGGFAKCYEVEQDGESYALKVVDRSILQKTKALQKLHSEISIHRRMKHKNIVNFIRTFQDEWNVYMLLELCSNQTLMEISKRRKRFSVPETQYVILQSLAAIQYMHDQCVIHRDLKLGNMMLDAEMNVKIGDFGLAAELRYDGERKRTICGTPNYIAPEIIDGAHEGHSYEVDIWSLGVILYTLLVGEPPFQTSDVKTTYRRIKQCRYEFPQGVDVPESGKELIHCILQSRPDHRPTLVEIRSHVFFRSPAAPLVAPSSLFSFSRHRAEAEELPPPQDQQKQARRKSDPVFGVAAVKPPCREILQPLSANAIFTGGRPLQVEKSPEVALFAARHHHNICSQKKAPTGATHHVDNAYKSQCNGRGEERRATAPQTGLCAFDDEERDHFTAIHDKLQQTLLEGQHATAPQSATAKVAAPITNTCTAGYGVGARVILEKEVENNEEAPNNKLLLPHVWVTDYADFSSKYGLCYKLNIGHTGVHFNDSTKMVWEPITERVEYYARVKEVVTRNNTNVVHARDQRETFHMDTYPESLTKKVTLIKYFRSYLARGRSGREGVQVVRCSPFIDQTAQTPLGELPITDGNGNGGGVVYVKRWLLTPQAIIFRLSNRTIQVCFHDKAEVILSSESRVVTYTDAGGRRVTMALAAVASRSREIAARLRYTKDILCELIQNREL